MTSAVLSASCQGVIVTFCKFVLNYLAIFTSHCDSGSLKAEHLQQFNFQFNQKDFASFCEFDYWQIDVNC